MGISSAAILSVVQALSMYCAVNGPGTSTEFVKYHQWGGDRDRSNSCYEKMWECYRDIQHGDDQDTRMFNCITNHVEGKLK